MKLKICEECGNCVDCCDKGLVCEHIEKPSSMKIEDIKQISPLDKSKFYLFRVGSKDFSIVQCKRLQEALKREGISAVIIQADDFEVIEIDKETYKLVKVK